MLLLWANMLYLFERLDEILEKMKSHPRLGTIGFVRSFSANTAYKNQAAKNNGNCTRNNF